MLYYDRTDISKGIYSTKSNISKESMICHFWFFNHGFKFQDSVSNGCHDLTISCHSISDIEKLKMLIIVVLFITLTNLKQLIY